jgi:hypothetical protein
MSDAAPPRLVRKRDGSLAPFDADAINRSLFAAAETLGRADAFLVRELTDGVVHFLAEESDSELLSTEQIAEVVVKVVRELGRPDLAEAFALRGKRPPQTEPSTELSFRLPADTPPDAVAERCLEQFSLQAVFGRDLATAHADGLLTLTDLTTPGELAGCVLIRWQPCDDLIETVAAARRCAGRFVVLDGPEYLLARSGGSDQDVGRFARELNLGLRLSGLVGVINLNGAVPPPAADDLTGGPLFAGQQTLPDAERMAALSDRCADALLGQARTGRLRVDWHLEPRDFLDRRRERLRQLVEAALAGAALGFVFDRPRRPVALAEGLDRRHEAALLTVGVHLPRLAEQPGVNGDAERLLAKLGSLARLALSAGVRKRAFLRRRGREHGAGFLLERARLVVAPVGLEAVVLALTGCGLCAGGDALELAKRIVRRLREELQRDGLAVHLDAAVDGPFNTLLTSASHPDTAGLTPWDATAAPKAQWRAASALHDLAEAGTLNLFVPEATADEVVGWLETMWKKSEVVRIRLLRSASGAA